MLTMSYWAPFLCCCQSVACGPEQTEITMSCGEKGAGSACSMAVATEQTEQVSPNGSQLASCQCADHQQQVFQIVLTPKAEHQPETLRTIDLLTAWMMAKKVSFSAPIEQPEMVKAVDIPVWEPSLSALGRFLI